MIRVVIFDLGQTLVDSQQRPFAHVREALETIASFKTADAKPLRTCLVSDFTMAPPPVTAPKVRVLFEEYLGTLEQTGLRPFFEPAQRRVTLSTHAGQAKPGKAVFETALRRLRVKATLEDCLLVTENAAHIKAVRSRLHMATLQFRTAGSDDFDFDDWSQVPALIAHLVGHQSQANTHAAIKAHLAARGIEVARLERVGTEHKFKASGHVWRSVSVPHAPNLQGIHVEVPVDGEVAVGPRGALHASMAQPSHEQLAEAKAFVGSLAAHGQISVPGAGRASRATHEITTDDKGQRRLVRKRFTAL